MADFEDVLSCVSMKQAFQCHNGWEMLKFVIKYSKNGMGHGDVDNVPIINNGIN